MKENESSVSWGGQVDLTFLPSCLGMQRRIAAVHDKVLEIVSRDSLLDKVHEMGALLKLHREHCRERPRKTTSWTLS
jgi:hypothetical protein